MMAITIQRQFIDDPDRDRYQFDFSLCTYAKGWAQVDTRQDASYYGTWANPKRRQIVNYAEGDVTIQTADTDEEFAEAVRELARWNDEHGWGPMRIDCLLRSHSGIAARFRSLGLADLLH